MNRNELEKIIRDYLKGKNTQEGKVLFDAWYASRGNENSPLENFSDEEKAAIKNEILHKSLQTGSRNLDRSLPRRKWIRPWYAVAAVWVGLMLAVTAYFFFFSSGSDIVTVSAGYAEVKSVYLPDSSLVTLNANSTLTYHEGWNQDTERKVSVEGEAFFSVVHTVDNRPFKVEVSNLNVEVLGTEFNVNNRKVNPEVMLYQGKVKLTTGHTGKNASMDLAPQELATFLSDKQLITKKIVNPEKYMSWRKQELILNSTTLEDIASLIENYYGIDVVIQNDGLKDLEFTATTRLSLKDKDIILTAISEIYDIKVTEVNKKIIFSNP